VCIWSLLIANSILVETFEIGSTAVWSTIHSNQNTPVTMGFSPGCQKFGDAVSECTIVSNKGYLISPPASGEPTTEVCRHPQLFRIWLESAERQDHPIQHDNLTQTRQLSNQQSNIPSAFNLLCSIALHQILPQVWENGEIGLDNLPCYIQLLLAAFGTLTV